MAFRRRAAVRAPGFSEMMTEEVRQIVDDEATLVSPRFDDEETIVARRVVPLGVAEGGARVATPAQVPARPSRRAWVLALAFASALAGGVLGGVGLHLYQSRATSNPPRDAGTNEPPRSPAGARADSGDEERAGARKRGKKGAHDGESQLLGRREDSDRELSRDDDDDPSFGRDARGEDATFGRPRRAWHHARHERRHPVDSIRGIFEGQPQ